MIKTIILVFTLFAQLTGNGGITGNGSMGKGHALVSIAVTPATFTASVNTVVAYTAVGTYSNGQTKNITGSVTWATSNGTVAPLGALTSTQAATCATPGSSNITATSGLIVSNPGALTCTGVPPPVIVSIAATPATFSSPNGGTVQYTAIATLSDGSTQDITSTATWASSAGGVATIAAGGLATCGNPGTGSTNITANQSSVTSPNAVLTCTASSTCGPPTYGCSRTDLAVAWPPISVPNVGILTGFNTIVTDPDFSNRIVRVTDTQAITPSHRPSFMANCGGSGDENLFNLDSTMFVVQDEGCATYPISFNSSTFQAAKIYPTIFQGGAFKILFGTFWSRSNRNFLYAANGTTIRKYDFTDWISGPQTTPPTPTLYADFTAASGGQHNCLTAGFTALSSSLGGPTANDTVGMAYSSTSGQGSAGMVYVVAFVPGKGCAMWNTGTGAITTDPGFVGGAGLTCGANGCTGTIAQADRFTIHNVKVEPDNNWMVVVGATCNTTCATGPYFWNIGTTTIGWCGQGGLCSGHWTGGNTTFTNQPGSNHVWQFAKRLFGFNTSSSLLIPLNMFPTFPGSGAGITDAHQGWNNADASDTYPFFWTSYVHNNTVNFGWQNEVLATTPSGVGTTWRFAHTFNSTQSQIFQVSIAEGSISQDGKYFMLTTDWEGHLGSEAGATTCTLGTDCRGDVFIVELR